MGSQGPRFPATDLGFPAARRNADGKNMKCLDAFERSGMGTGKLPIMSWGIQVEGVLKDINIGFGGRDK